MVSSQRLFARLTIGLLAIGLSLAATGCITPQIANVSGHVAGVSPTVKMYPNTYYETAMPITVPDQ